MLFRNALRLRGVAKYCTSPAQSSAAPAAEVPKEPLLVRWRRFWELLYADYKEVAIDTVTEVKTKPKKAAFYLTGIGATLGAIAMNPNEQCFREQVLENVNELLLIGDSVRNPQADAHMKLIAKSYNEGTLRRLNFGFFSIFWLDNYDPSCAVYVAQCDYLKPRYVDMIWRRVVDIGFYGRFWLLEKQMKDYDVSPAEWPNS